MRAIDRLTNSALAEGNAVGLALFRIVVGLMTLRYLVDFLRDWSSYGFYADYFFMPYTKLIPQPSEWLYVAVLVLGCLGAGAFIIGYRTRAAAIVCLLAVAYHFSLNQIWHRHNRYFLVLCLFLLCLAPSARALSLDALRLKLPPTGPLWSAFLIKAQMTLIYLASGISKTMDPAWRSGDVLAGRELDLMWVRIAPEFMLTIITPEIAVLLLTFQALASEFFLAIGLWFRQTRRLAIWWGILFHGFIEVQYSVITFSYLSLATYFLFADLQCGKKAFIYSHQRASFRCIARLLPYLDWLFQMHMGKYCGRGYRFVDRDGTIYTGAMGWIMLGANLPLFFPVCYPLSWLRFLGWGRALGAPATLAEEFTPRGASGVLGWTAAYLAFIAVMNLDGPIQGASDQLRFYDLPWFFALMCLMAVAYRQSILRGREVTPRPEPASRSAAAGSPTLEPSPEMR